MNRRNKIAEPVKTALLTKSRRRCCLCVYLDDVVGVRKGQIAHLNRDRSDNRIDNLVWLCFDHHDEYDSRTSQSKALTSNEVKVYREKLYARYQDDVPDTSDQISTGVTGVRLSKEEETDFERVRRDFPDRMSFADKSWRFPLWMVGNKPELFAYKANGFADAICIVERINIPDGRIVVAAMAAVGNPGISITNSVEELCFQVCERFRIPPDRLVWLEHYGFRLHDEEWSLVTFEKIPPEAPFTGPSWVTMTPEMWSDLSLRPKKRLRSDNGSFESKLSKKFYWPSEAIIDPD